MAKHKSKQEEHGVESIEQALTKTESFIEKNRKILLLSVLAVVVVVVAYLGYKNFIQAPREAKAQGQVFQAERMFQIDSFAVALNGDGNNLGFLDVMNEFSGTKTANLCHYYAGICYREMGDYQKALDMLKRYSLQDEMIAPVAVGAMGDCYMELGDAKSALAKYKEAASYKKNSFTTPLFLMKVAMILEQQGDWKGAVNCYTEIKNDYPKSQVARDIEKYIARAQAQVK